MPYIYIHVCIGALLRGLVMKENKNTRVLLYNGVLFACVVCVHNQPPRKNDFVLLFSSFFRRKLKKVDRVPTETASERGEID